jgi:hypothetical protein
VWRENRKSFDEVKEFYSEGESQKRIFAQKKPWNAQINEGDFSKSHPKAGT